jgi:hypothetical protein
MHDFSVFILKYAGLMAVGPFSCQLNVPENHFRKV